MRLNTASSVLMLGSRQRKRQTSNAPGGWKAPPARHRRQLREVSNELQDEVAEFAPFGKIFAISPSDF
jgi:hypothetical protein